VIASKMVEVPAKPSDPINPAHYHGSKLQAIEVIEDFDLGYCLGNALKYILRAGKKTADPVQDLKKAIWYLERECDAHTKSTTTSRCCP